MSIQVKNIPSELKQQNQWVVWSYVNRHGKACKIPFQVNGEAASSTDPTHWSSFDEAVAAYDTSDRYHGIGFVFSDSCEYMGVDLDNCLDPVDQGLKEWAQPIVESLSTYMEISPSGLGVKLFCKTEELKPGRKARVGDGAIELYYQGRYFTVTGNTIGMPVGPAYADDALSEIEAKYLGASHRQTTDAPNNERPQNAKERALLYCERYPPAISGSDGHGTTFRLACVLINGFDLTHDEATEALAHWNTKCDPPWNEAEILHKVNQAKKAGGRKGYMYDDDRPQSFSPVTDTELENVGVFLDELIQHEDPTNSQSEVPEHLLQVPGFIDEAAEWFDSQNPRKSRLLAFMGALALQGLLIGRKVRDRSGSRSNLYYVVCAPSGAGKQAPQNCIRRIMHAVGAGSMTGGKVSSDAAIAEDLVEQPSKLFIWDEFGLFLKQTSDPRNAHLHAVQSALLELWNATSAPWQHKSMGDRKNRREVNQPCLSYLGFSVESHFWEGMNRQHMIDGFAGRMIYTRISERPPIDINTEELDPPDSLLNNAKFWLNRQMEGNLTDFNPRPFVVERSADAQKVFDDLFQEQDSITDEELSPVWSRSVEKAARLAMIWACSENKDVPRVDRPAAEWACEFVRVTTKMLIAGASQHIIANDQFSQRYRLIRDTVERFTKRGQVCSRSYLLRTFRIKARELDEVVDTMIQGDVLERVAESSGRGRPAVAYRAK